MEHGWIKVGQPKTYQVDELIHIHKGQRAVLCVLKGEIYNLFNGTIFKPGMIYEHHREDNELDLKAVSESAVITIECDEIQSEKHLMERILTSTMDYISELKDKLLLENPSIRP